MSLYKHVNLSPNRFHSENSKILNVICYGRLKICIEKIVSP